MVFKVLKIQSPEQIWSNGIIDRFNGRLAAVADVRSDANISGHKHEWFGFNPDAPPPPDDGLSTAEVNEVNLDLPGNIISSCQTRSTHLSIPVLLS